MMNKGICGKYHNTFLCPIGHINPFPETIVIKQEGSDLVSVDCNDGNIEYFRIAFNDSSEMGKECKAADYIFSLEWTNGNNSLSIIDKEEGALIAKYSKDNNGSI